MKLKRTAKNITLLAFRKSHAIFVNRLTWWHNLKEIGMKAITLSLVLLALISMAHAGNIVNGKLKSDDGKFEHDFKANGEYWGKRTFSNSKVNAVSGVYKQGLGICGNTKGEKGNIQLYVGEVQCCLKFDLIANNYAVSKVWVEGTGTGYALCSHQVLTQLQ